MHPRLRAYPQHSDYARMAMEFRPYVMAVHTPNFRSASVNTDDLGFREQVVGDGMRLGLRDLKQYFDTCTVILGNSTVFGVDVSDDDRTISAFLNRNLHEPLGRHAVVNLGVRGATGAQEAHLFMFASRFLPEVKKLIVVSGINDAYVSVIDTGQRWLPFGALMSSRFYYLRFREQYNRMSTNREVRYHTAVEDWLLSEFSKPGRFRNCVFRAYHFFAANQRIEENVIPRSNEQRLEASFADIEATLSALRRLAPRANLTYVLQPMAQWTNKSLTRLEEEILAEDTKVEPVNAVYGTKFFHRRFAAGLQNVCTKSGIYFVDSNAWFNAQAYNNVEIFTDVCHLTDAGNEIFAEKLAEVC